MSKHDCKLILALDLPERLSALKMLKTLSGSLEWVKIGLQMYLRYGPDFVREVAGMGFGIFLDLKLHDIPNTVAGAVSSLKGLPVSMLTVHTCGGREMMERALESAKDSNPGMLLLGVTVLTSLNAGALAETGVARSPEDHVLLLARLARDSGMRGLVCSPLELSVLRRELPPDTVLVTPGIRPAGCSADGQKRITTPAVAAKSGSSFIVVGRPILNSANPAGTVELIKSELESAWGDL